MTYTPRPLVELTAYWKRKGGVYLGTIGDHRHCGGYHLGRDRIFGSCACRPNGGCVRGKGWSDYSVRLPRDKKGLSNAASAIDLGKLRGNFRNLYRFSIWLVKQCRNGADGTEDIKEIIFSPDGKRVFGFNAAAGRNSSLILNYGDSSHLWHTHISFYRDSESRNKVKIFAPFFGDKGNFKDSPPRPKPPGSGGDGDNDKPCPQGFHKNTAGKCVPDKPDTSPPFNEPWWETPQGELLTTQAQSTTATLGVIIGIALIAGVGVLGYMIYKSGSRLIPVIDRGDDDE